ncbi:17204_t:CDS:2, partial [Racocetra persica]
LVRQTIKEESNLFVVWAVGVYPTIFEKDRFFSVDGKIIPGFYAGNKRLKVLTNKCPLKISLIRIPQELLKVLENNENAIFNVLISDYTIQDHNFIVKIVFSHSNSCFAYLKSMIHLHDSLVFVVGQMEVIDNDFYIYAKDINYIDISCFKRKISDDSSFCGFTESVNSIRAKLLFTYRNVNENSKVTFNFEESFSAVLIDCLASSDSILSKRVRVEDDDELLNLRMFLGVQRIII